jgi:hypothetical protein
MIVLYDEIKKFVGYQKVLWNEFFLHNPELKDFIRLLDFPRNGYLEIDNEVWRFHKHGSGISFEREGNDPKLIVDMARFVNQPEIFNGWRLSIYLNSINYYIDDSDLDNKLKKMELDKVIKKVPNIENYYTLAD